MKAYEYLLQFTDRGSARKLAVDEGILDRKTREVGNEMDRTDRKAREMGRGFGMASSRGMGLTSMFGRMAASIAPLLTVTALLAGGGKLSKAASEYEQIGISFETMLGSAEQAKETIGDLNDFANFTPFSNDEVFRYSKSLLAYNIEAQDLLPTLGALGDIASGVGREKFPNLILAFGQVKAATKLTGMELRQFTETGVPMLELLSNVTGKSVSTIKEDLIPAGEIGFDLVQKALFSATQEGGKFFNLMEKQSTSFGGRLSTLKGKAGLLAIAYGDSVNKTLKPAINGLIDTTDTLLQNTKSTEQLYDDQIAKNKMLADSATPLIERYGELTDKASLNKEEQVELKTVTQQLADIIPSAVTKWNEYGEAISLASDKLRGNIEYNKQAQKLLNRDLIADKKEELQELREDASRITSTLNEIAAYGGVRERRVQKGEYFTFLKQFSDDQIRNLKDEVTGIMGKDGLISALEKQIAILSGEEIDSPSGDGDGGDDGSGGLGKKIEKGINGITAGGGKNVTINFGGVKFAESIQFSVKDSEEAKSKMEPQMREFFNRLLQGGLHTATGG